MSEQDFQEAKSALAFSQNLMDKMRQPVMEEPEEDKTAGETILGGVDVGRVEAPTKLTPKPF